MDSELKTMLVFALTAVGKDYTGVEEKGLIVDHKKWNPRDNTEDAMRLAVDLRLHLDIDSDCVNVFIHRDFGNDDQCRLVVVDFKEVKGDKLSALRLAITQAAAMIGEVLGTNSKPLN